MNITEILHIIGILAILLYAIPSAIWPHWVAKWLEHDFTTGRGSTEFRVLHGGSLLGMALFALYTRNPFAYQTLGWGWIGAALIRLLAYYPDSPKLNATYIASLILEALLGIFLLI